MAPASIRSVAGLVMSVAAVGLTLFVAPLAQDVRLPIKAAVALASAIGFYFLFAASLKVLLRWHYADILGEWLYVTVPDANTGFRDSGYGRMRFSLNSAFELEYTVALYASAEALLEPHAPARGTATSLSCHFDAQRKELHLVFHVVMIAAGGNARTGRLSLRLINQTLQGRWISELQNTNLADGSSQFILSSGAMRATRPDQFKAIIHAERSTAST